MSQALAGPTVVLGLGDAQFGDDGIGLAALMRLREEWHFSPVVDLVDARTWNSTLMDTIEAASAALIITSLDSALEPGQITEISAEELPGLVEGLGSLDRVDLALALAIANWRGRLPQRISLLAVQPHSDTTYSLSPRVAARLDVVLFKAIRRLESWGHAAWRSAPLGVHAHA